MRLSKPLRTLPIGVTLLAMATAMALVPALGSAATAAVDPVPPPPVPERLPPIAVDQAETVVIETVTAAGYQDEAGRTVVDLLSGDSMYLEVLLSTPEGRPVSGAAPEIMLDGNSRLAREQLKTGANGVLTFEVFGVDMGLDRIFVSMGDARQEILVNVIRPTADAGFADPMQVEGGLSWDLLMQARFEWKEQKLTASFPDEIQAQAGEVVRVSGFMMPMDPELKQKYFLLTSSPPTCFFHMPGGPAGSVEVHAVEGIEVSWDPVVVEGRFEPLKESPEGIVYRLKDAKLVEL
ncbi:MAG: hypothetical protein AAGI15_07510 [Pseudomonadota bacterium]